MIRLTPLGITVLGRLLFQFLLSFAVVWWIYKPPLDAASLRAAMTQVDHCIEYGFYLFIVIYMLRGLTRGTAWDCSAQTHLVARTCFCQMGFLKTLQLWSGIRVGLGASSVAWTTAICLVCLVISVRLFRANLQPTTTTE